MLYFMAMRQRILILALILCGIGRAADDRLQLAEGYMRREMMTDAAAEYEDYLKDPRGAPAQEMVEARFQLALCYEALGRRAEARDMYRQVEDGTTGERRGAAMLRRGVSFLEDGQPAAALPLLENVVTGRIVEGELLTAAKFRLGQCYEALGRGSDAATLYRILMEGPGPYAASARVALAEIAAKQGNVPEAMKRYQEVLAGETDAARREGFAARAFSLAYGAKEYAGAVGFARVVGEKALGEKRLLLAAAWAALRAGFPEEARGWLAAEEVARPKATANRLMLAGAVYEALGDRVSAVTAYERVVGEFPNAPEARGAAEAMLFLRAKAGDPEAFLKAYNRVATLLSDEVAAQMAPLRLDAALQTKDVRAAKVAAQWLVEHGEGDVAAEASYRLGWLAQEAQAWLEAGETWLRTAERWPKAKCAGRAAYAAAYAFMQAGAPDRMEVALRAALESGEPEVIGEALMLKARGLLSEQETSGASAALDEYLTRFPQGKSLAEASYLRGLIFFNAKDFKAAEERLGVALTAGVEEGSPVTPLDHARRVDAAMRRAQALHSLGRGDEAAALLQPLLGLKDAAGLSPAYLRWLAEFRLDREEWEAAEAAARALGEHAGCSAADRVAASVFVGRAAEKLGRTATALEAYEQAMLSGSRLELVAEAAFGVGRLRLAGGNAELAREAFKAATELSGTSTPIGRALRGKAFDGLAQAYLALGDSEQELRADMNLIIFYDDPVLVPAAFRRAIGTLEKLGRTKEAETLRKECEQRYGAAALQAPIGA